MGYKQVFSWHGSYKIGHFWYVSLPAFFSSENTEYWIPQIFWSQLKWNLLGNGAVQCLSYVNIHDGVIDIKCLNDVASPGRYLYLKFQNKDISPVEEILNRNWHIRIVSGKG